MRLFLVSFAALILLSGSAAFYVVRWNDAPLALTEPVVVVLEAGEPFSKFAARISASGYLTHPRLWSRLARLRGLARQAKAGEYALQPGDTPERLLQRIVRGEVVTYEVRLLEGWTVMQVLLALQENQVLEHELVGANVTTLLEALGLPGGHAEGLFYPDTYQFVRGSSDRDILRRAYDRMQMVLEGAWDQRASGLPYRTPYEALIVASLVEKETGRDEDREHISQVFVSRLNANMRLQTDPSVIYGLGERFDGNLKRVHLRESTPYNTYVIRGLPPTPIALPGGKSIDAALHPGPGDYLYFVSRGDGTSQFSRSHAEHLAAVRKYQLK
ncbi:MAG TPA: endolytic transglycosylase MltG [Pseudomonadales bacterium]|jgi:UPF0755 protein